MKTSLIQTDHSFFKVLQLGHVLFVLAEIIYRLSLVLEAIIDTRDPSRQNTHLVHIAHTVPALPTTSSAWKQPLHLMAEKESEMGFGWGGLLIFITCDTHALVRRPTPPNQKMAAKSSVAEGASVSVDDSETRVESKRFTVYKIVVRGAGNQPFFVFKRCVGVLSRISLLHVQLSHCTGTTTSILCRRK